MPRKYVRLEDKNAKQLIPVADEWFSKYVRLRDSERQGQAWYGKCITCTKQGKTAWIDETGKLRFVADWDAGHFITRGHKQLRYDEENVNLQCSFHCNRLNSGNILKYKPALDTKYGPDCRERLEEESKLIHKLRKDELLEIIEDSKTRITYLTK